MGQLPTICYCLSPSNQIDVTGGTAPTGHKRVFIGVLGPAIPTTVSTNARHGDRSWSFNVTAAASYLEAPAFNAATETCGRIAVRFIGGLPNIDTNIFTLQPAVGVQCSIGFRVATSDLVGRFGTGATVTPTAYPIVADKWYVLELTANVATTTRSLEARIWDDDSKVVTDLGSVTIGEVVTVFNNVRWGPTTVSSITPTVEVQFTDLAVSETAGDYPLGDGYVFSRFLDVDGTHSVTTSGNFKKDNTTNITGAETDLFTFLDESDMTAGADRLTANVVAANDYLEFIGQEILGNVRAPNYGIPRCLNVIATVRNEAGTTANGISLKLISGANTATVINNASLASAANLYLWKAFPTDLDGSQWTKESLAAVKARFGYASNITNTPGLWALRFDIEYVPEKVQGRLPMITLL